MPRGDGPTEYRHPATLQKIWGNQFAVGTVHEVHIYSHEGEHIRRLSATDGYLIPRGTFDWLDKSKFYSVDWFGPNYLNEPYVAILDTTEINKAQRLGAFFERPSVEGNRLGVFSFRAFARVKNTFWAASPYEGRIKVFDLEGNFLENLELGRADILTPEIYKELAEKHPSGRELVQAMREYESIYQIIPLESIVMVRCSRILVFYDLSGNLLATGARANVGELIVPIGNDRVVTQVPNIPLAHRARYYASPKNQALLKALKAVGFDQNVDDETIYLRVSRLVGP